MKITLAVSILFCAITLPGFAALTDADFDKIRLIVKDSENSLEKSLKEHIKSEINASEKRTKEYVSQEIETVNAKIETVNVKISETDKRLSQIFWLVIALIGLIAAAIGVPQWLNRKDREQSANLFTREQTKEFVEELLQELTSEDKKVIEKLIHDRDEKIESLTREIETLKEQRIVNP